MSYAIEQKRSVKPSDGRWLLLGVALHALVLLIPLKTLTPGSISQSAELMVRFVMKAEEVVFEKELPPPEFIREVLSPRPQVADTVELTRPERSIEQQEEQTDPERSDEVSAARLMSMRDTLTERVPLARLETPRTLLGEPRPYSPPVNWTPHTGAKAVAPYNNQFNGMTVPEDVEVVDRWIGSNGTRNVIVETPAGYRLCGRAEAPDPMRPHIEHVTHFHVCGGDGAIEFKFKPRERLNRDFIDPVAKDTTQP